MNNTTSIRVQTHWIMRVIAALGFVLFGGLAIINILNKPDVGTIGAMLLFVAVSVYLLILAGSFIELTSERVEVAVPNGRYQIRWGEVTSITTNGQAYAFVGKDKRLVISLSLASKAGQRAREFMKEECARRGIEISQSVAVPLTHENTKLK